MTERVTHAEEIIIAIAKLESHQDVFSREDVREKAGIKTDIWASSYNPIFQGMREDHPGGAPVVSERFRNVFWQIKHGKYGLTDYGKRLVHEYRPDLKDEKKSMVMDEICNGDSCCNSLFKDFTFEGIKTVLPPDKKGVYVIRIKKRGKPIDNITKEVDKLIKVLNWPLVTKKIRNRMERLEKISSCQIIYIGSAGTQETSKYQLRGRYKDFSGRHTIMFPLWSLLYFGWGLDYGWIEETSPARLEQELKIKYKELHRGNLPALVYR